MPDDTPAAVAGSIVDQTTSWSCNRARTCRCVVRDGGAVNVDRGPGRRFVARKLKESDVLRPGSHRVERVGGSFHPRRRDPTVPRSRVCVPFSPATSVWVRWRNSLAVPSTPVR